MPSSFCRVSECATLQQCFDELAEKYPRTKFLKIYSTDCIPNYPDRNLPTTLIYKDTKCIQHLIGMGAFGGPKVNPERESAQGQICCAMLSARHCCTVPFNAWCPWLPVAQEHVGSWKSSTVLFIVRMCRPAHALKFAVLPLVCRSRHASDVGPADITIGVKTFCPLSILACCHAGLQGSPLPLTTLAQCAVLRGKRTSLWSWGMCRYADCTDVAAV